jgi:hypothetical protein
LIDSLNSDQSLVSPRLDDEFVWVVEQRSLSNTYLVNSQSFIINLSFFTSLFVKDSNVSGKLIFTISSRLIMVPKRLLKLVYDYFLWADLGH